MWALGCLIFELLTSILPWSSPVGSPFPLRTLQSYCRNPTPLLLKHFSLKPVSDEDDVLRLVHGLLRPNPRSRGSATGALQSTWLASAGTDSAIQEGLDELEELIPAEDDEESDQAGRLILHNGEELDEAEELEEGVELIPTDDGEQSEEAGHLIVSDNGEEQIEADDSILAGEAEELDEEMELIPADDTEESDRAAELTPADDRPSADPIPDLPDARENSDDGTQPAELLIEDSGSNIEDTVANTDIAMGEQSDNTWQSKESDDDEEPDDAREMPTEDGFSANLAPDAPDARDSSGDRTRPTDPRRQSSGSTIVAPAASKNSAVGEEPDEAGEDVQIALKRAAWSGNTTLVKRLLAAGARADVRDRNGNTAILQAAWAGQAATIDFLLQSGNSTHDERDSEGATCLLYAAYNGHNEALELLLLRGASITDSDKSGSTAPMEAAFNGHADTLAALHGHGADLRRRNRDGDTALSLAASQGHLNSVMFLLDQGVDIDQRSFDGYTPLLKAAANGHTEVARFLLCRGADTEWEVDEGDIISVAEGNEHYGTAEELRTYLRTMEIERRQQRIGQRSSRRLAR